MVARGGNVIYMGRNADPDPYCQKLVHFVVGVVVRGENTAHEREAGESFRQTHRGIPEAEHRNFVRVDDRAWAPRVGGMEELKFTRSQVSNSVTRKHCVKSTTTTPFSFLVIERQSERPPLNAISGQTDPVR